MIRALGLINFSGLVVPNFIFSFSASCVLRFRNVRSLVILLPPNGIIPLLSAELLFLKIKEVQPAPKSIRRQPISFSALLIKASAIQSSLSSVYTFTPLLPNSFTSLSHSSV